MGTIMEGVRLLALCVLFGAALAGGLGWAMLVQDQAVLRWQLTSFALMWAWLVVLSLYHKERHEGRRLRYELDATLRANETLAKRVKEQDASWHLLPRGDGSWL